MKVFKFFYIKLYNIQLLFLQLYWNNCRKWKTIIFAWMYATPWDMLYNIAKYSLLQRVSITMQKSQYKVKLSLSLFGRIKIFPPAFIFKSDFNLHSETIDSLFFFCCSKLFLLKFYFFCLSLIKCPLSLKWSCLIWYVQKYALF